MTVTIRQAITEDAQVITCAEKEIAKTPGYFCSNPSELSEESVRHTIESPLSIYLVAECNGQIVGHAFLESYSLKSLSHLADLNIAVHLGWQKKGIGRALLLEIIERAKNSGVIEIIQLNVRASNIIAISLYKKLGFQEEGRLKNRLKINDDYIDDVVMALDIRSSKESRDK